jgi:hypothetical protein
MSKVERDLKFSLDHQKVKAGIFFLLKLSRSLQYVAAPVKKTELTTRGGGEIRCADHVTSAIRKNWH